MIGFIIWLIGTILTFKAVFEIATMHATFWKKLIAIVLLLATSWIGLLVYYFIARPRIEVWLK